MFRLMPSVSTFTAHARTAPTAIRIRLAPIPNVSPFAVWRCIGKSEHLRVNRLPTSRMLRDFGTYTWTRPHEVEVTVDVIQHTGVGRVAVACAHPPVDADAARE